MSHPAADRLPQAWLAAAMGRLPDGVAVFDGDWVIRYANPAAARLLGADTAELVGRNLWIALPEVAGSVFHSFLLHARAVGTPVTWRGYYAPTGRWLSATAELVDDLLQVCFREAADLPAEGPADDADDLVAASGEGADRDRLRFLAEVSEALITTLDRGESASQLAGLVVRRLADWAVVVLAGEDGGPGEEAWAHRDPDRRVDLDAYMTGRLRGTGDDAAMVDALLTGEPVQITTIPEEQVAPSLPTQEVRAAWRRLDTSSCTIVPLRARGETFGALALMNAGARPPHTEMEIATAVEAARRGALALDNARLYGRQLKVAETLQRSLLTPPPQPDRLEIAVRYRPASAHALVGGDFYDAFLQPDGATLLVVGDVAGHSVEAAAAMSQLRSAVRTIAYDRPDSPAQTLGRVDRALTGLGFGTLATALVARIEQPAEQARAGLRTLRWSSAGHLPPLRLHPDGTVDLLDSPPERLLGVGEPTAPTTTTPSSPCSAIRTTTADQPSVSPPRTARDAGVDRDRARVFPPLGGRLRLGPGMCWRLLAATGMRRGQALAMRWRDVDLDAARIEVRRSVGVVMTKGAGEELVERPTKTGQSRVVDLDAGTVTALRVHRTARERLSPDLVRDTAVVQSNLDGTHRHPERFSRRFAGQVARARKELGEEQLPVIRLHDLRHTHATLLLADGVPVKVASERLGRQAADRFAALLDG